MFNLVQVRQYTDKGRSQIRLVSGAPVDDLSEVEVRVLQNGFLLAIVVMKVHRLRQLELLPVVADRADDLLYTPTTMRNLTSHQFPENYSKTVDISSFSVFITS